MAGAVYISYVLGQCIRDPEGRELGRLDDLVASPAAPHLPVIAAVVVKVDKRRMQAFAWESFDYEEDTEEFSLAVPADEARPYQIQEQDLLLRTNVLDKQIVDVHDYRVVRVNDVRGEPSGDVTSATIGYDAVLSPATTAWIHTVFVAP